MSKIGFIGLGIMGKPMSFHLAKGGHELFTYSLHGVPPDVVAAGATACGSGKEVARKADIVITMVPDTPDVAAALFGSGGVAEGLSPGKIVVDMSSISPVDTKQFAQKINALECQYLDAPVSGGEVGAKAASLTIMVGGPEDAFNKVKPLFELMGKKAVGWRVMAAAVRACRGCKRRDSAGFSRLRATTPVILGEAHQECPLCAF